MTVPATTPQTKRGKLYLSSDREKVHTDALGGIYELSHSRSNMPD